METQEIALFQQPPIEDRLLHHRKSQPDSNSRNALSSSKSCATILSKPRLHPHPSNKQVVQSVLDEGRLDFLRFSKSPPALVRSRSRPGALWFPPASLCRNHSRSNTKPVARNRSFFLVDSRGVTQNVVGMRAGRGESFVEESIRGSKLSGNPRAPRYPPKLAATAVMSKG